MDVETCERLRSVGGLAVRRLPTVGGNIGAAGMILGGFFAVLGIIIGGVAILWGGLRLIVGFGLMKHRGWARIGAVAFRQRLHTAPPESRARQASSAEETAPATRTRRRPWSTALRTGRAAPAAPCPRAP